MTYFLTVEDLDELAEGALGPDYSFRDRGLWLSAVTRHQGVVFGEDVYPGLAGKAAALLHSITGMHPLTDGNKRVGIAAVLLFYGLNDRVLEFDEDEAFEFVLNVAAGKLSEVEDIAAVLETWER